MNAKPLADALAASTFAIATIEQTYGEPITSRLVMFRTTRRGARVERLRWTGDGNTYVSFGSVRAAVAYAKANNRFSDVCVTSILG